MHDHMLCVDKEWSSAEEKCVTTKLCFNVQLWSRQENTMSSAMRVDKLCFSLANVNGINGTICHICFCFHLSRSRSVHQDIVSLQRRLNVKRYEMRNELSFHLLLLCLVRLWCARAHRPCSTAQRFCMQQRQSMLFSFVCYYSTDSCYWIWFSNFEPCIYFVAVVCVFFLVFFDFIKKSGKIRCPA